MAISRRGLEIREVVKFCRNKKKRSVVKLGRRASRMEVLEEQISKVETAELGGQEFQLAVLTALLQVSRLGNVSKMPVREISVVCVWGCVCVWGGHFPLSFWQHIVH